MLAARIFLRSSVLMAAAALAACAQPGNVGVPAAPLALRDNVVSDAVATPPPCKGQKKEKDYASLSVTLSIKGGSFCVPAFDGFGGTISYPKVKQSVGATIISSSTNYNKLPQLGTGTAMFYLQFSLLRGTTFGDQVSPVGGLTAQSIKAGRPYTAYGQLTVGGVKTKFGPCYSAATKGKYGGVIGSIGALFEYGIVPGKAKGFIEIYSSKQTDTQC
jgi:hypothetical protein